MELHTGAKGWRDDLESLASLGSQDKGVSRLADLHEARKRHLGQFFTPLEVVSLIWRIAGEAFAPLTGKRSISLLDNSVGSARMFHFADPANFTLAGVDIHAPVMEATQAAAEAAGFTANFTAAGMQDVVVESFDCALINPPFSIHIDSPHLQALPCTRAGRYGPNSAATSDEYALAQALDAADIVIAVLPKSFAEEVIARGAALLGECRDRLAAVLELPAATFKQEGANVETVLAIFGSLPAQQVRRETVKDLKSYQPPPLGLTLQETKGKPRLRVRGISTDEPVITQPVTGDPRVRVVHSGRKIHLKTYCGLWQARVYNSVLEGLVFSQEGLRLARGVRYSGQGLLDVEAIVASGEPRESLGRLLDRIAATGAVPLIDEGLRRHIERRSKQALRGNTPFGHWIVSASLGNEVQTIARQTVSLEPNSWTAPVIRKGEKTVLERSGEGWIVRKDSASRQLSTDEAEKFFDMPTEGAGWTQIYPPLQKSFPEMAQSLRARATSLGIDRWLNWDFQFEDLIEVTMKPTGAVVGWKQGLGKARLAAALILLRGVKAGLVAMPAYLLGEFEKRLEAAGLEKSSWQVIESVSQLVRLRTINVISYERLRMKLGPGSPQTYAKRLRHRIGMLVADEGEVLANPDSDQSRALAVIAAPVLYVLTGTPIANYPRDLLPISAAAVGDGVDGQPYGWHHPMLTSQNASSMAIALRGIDTFREEFVATEWVTHEWTESMTEGAKREVPKVQNLTNFRGWLSKFVKRRLPDEPEVVRFVRIPTPSNLVHEVAWDDQHLGHYLRTADHFAQWFRSETGRKRTSNLMLLLARIGAVERACNVPQMTPTHGPPWRGGLTSKQQFVLQRIQELVQAGDKIVVFAKNPEQLELYESNLRAKGTETVLFHGRLDRAKRNRELDKRFRYGDARVLLATVGVMQAGWDIYQASRALFVDRSWSAKIEDQAARRLLRPQQTKPVTLEFFHLAGSIDIYQAQMVEWKANAADSGLDWASPMGDEVSFLHLDHVIEQFVADMAKMHGLRRHEYRDMIKEAA